MTATAEVWRRHVRLILDSYRHWLGSDLIERADSPEGDAGKLFRAPFVVVSHDTVWCWRGQPIPFPELTASLAPNWHPLHFVRNIAPRLLAGGATQGQIEQMLVENPRRFFSGAPLPALP